jgi:hypothetical protein
MQTYPKSSPNPSSSVGEQEGQLFQNDGDVTRYPNTTHRDTIYNGDRVHTKECSGGSGSPCKCDYPPKRVSFGTEKVVSS